jgi:hypothetical protein
VPDEIVGARVIIRNGLYHITVERLDCIEGRQASIQIETAVLIPD